LGGAGLRVAAFDAGRLAEEAGLGCALATGLRRAAAVALAAGVRAEDAGRAGRLAAGLTDAFGFGRDAVTRRVAVACLAGAAAFFVLGAGRAGLRDGLLTALPTRGRFPDPLAGVDAFIRAISPSSTGHRERGMPSISPGIARGSGTGDALDGPARIRPGHHPERIAFPIAGVTTPRIGAEKAAVRACRARG
jgi:hypothetical protein